MEDEEKYFNACLEEYKTLREESEQASINMISSMSIGLGTAAIATIYGFSFLTDKNNYSISAQNLLFPLTIFCLIVPFLLFLITAFWLGELARFKRAGNYICFIEAKISLLLNKFYKTSIETKWKEIQPEIEEKLKMTKTKSEIGRPLQWEIWLRSFTDDKNSKKILTTSGHMKWIYNIRAILLLFSFCSIILFGFWLVITFYSILSLLSFIILVVSMTVLTFFYLVLFFTFGKQLGIKQGPVILSKLFPPDSPNDFK
jgi:hypothetical protein